MSIGMMRSDLAVNDWPLRQQWLRQHADGAEITVHAAERLRRTGYIDRFGDITPLGREALAQMKWDRGKIARRRR